MSVRFHPHARDRLVERGATEDEVRATVEQGERFPALHGRTGFRRNFPFDDVWRGRRYRTKQVDMKFSYDPRYGIAYIRFAEKQSEVEAIRVSDELIVDIAPDGTVYGLELLNANEQLARENEGSLLVVNEATGMRDELPLGMRAT